MPGNGIISVFSRFNLQGITNITLPEPPDILSVNNHLYQFYKTLITNHMLFLACFMTSNVHFLFGRKLCKFVKRIKTEHI